MRTATADDRATPEAAPRPVSVSPAASHANREQAQQGLAIVKSSVLGLLCRKRHGLTNAEICQELDLAAGQNGKMKSMLSWSILGLLVQ